MPPSKRRRSSKYEGAAQVFLRCRDSAKAVALRMGVDPTGFGAYVSTHKLYDRRNELYEKAIAKEQRAVLRETREDALSQIRTAGDLWVRAARRVERAMDLLEAVDVDEGPVDAKQLRAAQSTVLSAARVLDTVNRVYRSIPGAASELAPSTALRLESMLSETRSTSTSTTEEEPPKQEPNGESPYSPRSNGS